MPEKNQKTYLIISRGKEDKGTFIENAEDFDVQGGVLYVSNDIQTIAAFSEWVSIQEVEDE